MKRMEYNPGGNNNNLGPAPADEVHAVAPLPINTRHDQPRNIGEDFDEVVADVPISIDHTVPTMLHEGSLTDTLLAHQLRDTCETLNTDADTIQFGQITPKRHVKVIDLRSIITQVYIGEPTHAELVERVLTHPAWEDARVTIANPPKTNRRVLRSKERRKACPGKNDTCTRPLIGNIPMCWGCILETYGFVLNNIPISTKEFVVRCILIHAGVYDYTHTTYVGNKKSIQYTCSFHGENNQNSSNHMHGNGCRQCSKSATKTPAEWIAAFIRVHGEGRYIYNETIVVGAYNKVKIHCPRHNSTFEQLPGSHLQGKGCMRCGIEAMAKSHTYTKAEFLTAIQGVHPEGWYGYDDVEYEKCNINVKILCKRCNRHFEQTLDNHKQGKGCRRCNKSKLEIAAETILTKFGIAFNDEATFDDLFDVKHLRFDCYIADLNIAIELDGNQHFKCAPGIMGGLSAYQKRIKHDNMKDDWCRKNKKVLIRISHEDIDNMEEILDTAIYYAKEVSPLTNGGYILATEYYRTYKDRDTTKYIVPL